MTKTSQKQHPDPISRSAGNLVQSDVIESVNFAEFLGFYDVTRNFELNFRAIGWLYLDFWLSLSTFELFLMAISIKIGQVPHLPCLQSGLFLRDAIYSELVTLCKVLFFFFLFCGVLRLWSCIVSPHSFTFLSILERLLLIIRYLLV